jgi:hypothetical protein
MVDSIAVDYTDFPPKTVSTAREVPYSQAAATINLIYLIAGGGPGNIKFRSWDCTAALVQAQFTVGQLITVILKILGQLERISVGTP